MLQVLRVSATSTLTSSPSVCWTWWWGEVEAFLQGGLARACTPGYTPECSTRSENIEAFLGNWKTPSRIQLILFPQYHWMYSATAYNHAYNDSGIFCIHASSHPQSLVELTQVGCCCWNNLITAERKMIRAGIGARVSGDNRKNLSGGIGQSEDTGFVSNVRLVHPSYSSVEVDAADELGIPACHFWGLRTPGIKQILPIIVPFVDLARFDEEFNT